MYAIPQLEDIAIKVPDDISLYNLRDAAPGIYMPRSDALEELIRYGREHMDEVLGDVSDCSNLSVQYMQCAVKADRQTKAALRPMSCLLAHARQHA